MSWQAVGWSEIQARVPERLFPAFPLGDARIIEALALIAAFLTPFALMEFALGFWRLCADLGWAGQFFINQGVLSHWQVWFALTAFTQASGVFLNRALAKQAEFVKAQK
jgi:hypothetical protein